MNSDGTSRQEIVKRLRKGEKVVLEPDPTNEHDRWAVKVLTADGKQVGWLPSDARDASALLRGEPISAQVHAVTGGTNWLKRLLGKKHVGLLLQLSKDEPDWTRMRTLEELARPCDEKVQRALDLEKSGDSDAAIEADQDAITAIRHFTTENPQASAHRRLPAPVDRLSLLLERRRRYREALTVIEESETAFDPVQPSKSTRVTLQKRRDRLRKRLDKK